MLKILKGFPIAQEKKVFYTVKFILKNGEEYENEYGKGYGHGCRIS